MDKVRTPREHTKSIWWAVITAAIIGAIGAAVGQLGFAVAMIGVGFAFVAGRVLLARSLSRALAITVGTLVAVLFFVLSLAITASTAQAVYPQAEQNNRDQAEAAGETMEPAEPAIRHCAGGAAATGVISKSLYGAGAGCAVGLGRYVFHTAE